MGNNDSVIESEQLETLVMAAGVETVATILDAFWRSNHDILEALKNQLSSNDFNEAAKSAHALKGSAANLGAALLADRAKEIEEACRDQDANAAQDVVDRVPAAIESTRVAFANLMNTAA